MDVAQFKHHLAEFQDSAYTVDGAIAGGLVAVGIMAIIVAVTKSSTGWTFRVPPIIRTPTYDAGFDDFATGTIGAALMLSGIAHAAHGHGGIIPIGLGVVAGALCALVMVWWLKRADRDRRGIDV
jgi:hypothetical protein